MYQTLTKFSRISPLSYVAALVMCFFMTGINFSSAQCPPGNPCNVIVTGGVEPVPMILNLNAPTGGLTNAALSAEITPGLGCGYGGAIYNFLVFTTSTPVDGSAPSAADRSFSCADVGTTVTLYAFMDDNNGAHGNNGLYDADCDGRPVEISLTINDAAPPLLVDPAMDCTTLDATLECGTAVTTYVAGLPAAVAALYNDNCTNPVNVALSSDSGDSPGTADGCPATRTIVYDVSDDSGNTVQCTVVLTINDTTAPTWDAPDAAAMAMTGYESYNGTTNVLFVRLDCDDPDLATQIAAWEAYTPAATETCNTASVTFDRTVTNNATRPSCRVERRRVFWDATDECTNVTAPQFEVRIRVFDNNDPVFDDGATSSEAATTDAPDCHADLTASTLLERTATDCQTGLTYSYTITITSGPTMAEFETLNGAGSLSGTDENANLLYPPGVYSIIYTASTPGPNCIQTENHTLTLTVTDDDPPVVSGCPSNINENTVTGTCSNTVSWVPPTAVDNCAGTVTRMVTTSDPSVVVNDLDPNLHFAQVPKGTLTVTYTFTDASNVMSTCMFDITIVDNENPNIDDCDDKILESICAMTTVPDYTTNSVVTDNCPMVTVTQSPAAGTMLSAVPGLTLADGETFMVTLTATDMAGLTDQCTFTVTLEDEDQPIPDVDPLPAINPTTTLGTDCGMYELCAPTATDCNGTIIYGTATISGAILDPNGCGAGVPSYNFLSAGVWSITWIYDDGNGNVSTQLQEVMIEDDTTAPTISCPNDAVVNTDPGVCTATGIAGIGMTEIFPTIAPYLDAADSPNAGEGIDNCGIAEWAYQIDQGGSSVVARTIGSNAGVESFPLGTSTVTYYATDAAGLETSCTFTVEVIDNQNPTLSCPPSFLGTIILNSATNGDTAGDCVFDVVGDYLDLTNVDDNCSIADTTLTVTPINAVVYTPGPDANSLNGASFDLDPTALSTGMANVTWTVTDGSGRTASCSFILMMRDNEDPMLTCPADQTRGISEDLITGDCVYTTQGTEFDIPAADVSDNCAISFGFNNINFAASLAGQDFPIGTTSVTWTYVDLAGNSENCTFDVIITDDEAPVFSYCPANVTLNNTTNECSQLHVWQEPDINDVFDCTPGVIITRISDDASVDLALNINYPYDQNVVRPTVTSEFPVGETYVYYIATDAVGNMDTCKLLVTVLDTEAPVFTLCPGNQDLGNICSNDVVPDYRNLATVTDNCNNYSLTQDPAPGTLLFDVFGRTPVDGDMFTVTLSATDINPNGGTADCMFTVTLDDEDAPVPDISGASLPDIYTSCGEVIVTAPTATDCGVTIYGTTSAGTFLGGTPPQYSFGPGSYNFAWTYIDADNNASFQNQIIIVEVDIVPPEVVCPIPAMTYGTDAPLCTASNLSGLGMTEGMLGSLVPGTYADTCSTGSDLVVEYALSGATNVARMVGSDAGSETFNQGTTTVTYWVTDSESNTNMCSFDVLVEDDDAPIFIAPADVTVQCDAVPAINPLTANDNCDGNIPAILRMDMRTDGSCDDTYTITRKWEATDAAGNTATGTQIISVIDTIAPIFSLSPGDKDISTFNDLDLCGATVNLQILTSEFADNCASDADVTITNSYNGNGADATDYYPVGSTTVTFMAEDNCGNTRSFTAVVTVTDNQDPVIGCLQGLAFGIPDTDTLVLRPEDLYFVLRDNCSDASNITVTMSQSIFTCDDLTGNQTSVQLTAEDENGNTSTCDATLTIQDYILPEAVCQDVTAYVDGSGTVTINATSLDNGSTDNCDNPLLYYINVIGQTSEEFDCGDLGTNSSSLIVEDPYGNRDVCNSDITIIDTIRPVASCRDITVELDAAGMQTIVAADVNNGSSDNCDITNYSLSLSSFDCSDIGKNSVTLTVTDASLNSSSCVAVVTVQDNVDPVAVCKDTTIYLDNNGMVTIDSTFIDGGSSDACGNFMMSFKDNFDCDETGPNTVVVTVTDGSNNTDQCTATVTVLDTIKPIASCTDVTVNLDSLGMASINVNDIYDALNSSDNCEIMHARLDRMDFDCSNKNMMNPVVLSLEDPSGNIGNCTANVTVLDITPPTVVCRDITVQVSTGSNATINTGMVLSTLWDACGVQTTSLSQSTFDCSDLGANNVLVTAVDFTGNINTCMANVFVEFDSPPTASCQDVTVTLGANGTPGEAVITASDVDAGSTDACGSTDQLIVTVDQTIFGCGDLGDNTVTVTVEDRFGTTSTCTATVTVNASELGVQIADVSGDQGMIIDVPITVTDFTEITSLQFTTEIVNSSIAQIVGTTINLPNTTFVVNSTSVATFQFSAPSAVPQSRANGTVIGTIQVELLGTMGQSTPIVFTDSQNARQWSSDCPDIGAIVGFDEDTGSATVDNSAAMFQMSGNVSYYTTGSPMDQVSVQISYAGVPTDTVLTDALGNYAFMATAGSSPEICPISINQTFASDRDFYLAKAGVTQYVTALDLFVMSSHIFNSPGSRFTDPYQLIAADVSETAAGTACDGSEINGGDIASIVAVLEGAGSWIHDAYVFIPSSFTFPNPLCPWEGTGYPECISVTSVGANTANLDFTTVKIGDANEDYASNTNLTGEEDKSNVDRDLMLEYQIDGDVLRIDMMNELNLGSAQFTLEYNPEKVTIDEVNTTFAMSNLSAKHLPEENAILIVAFDLNAPLVGFNQFLELKGSFENTDKGLFRITDRVLSNQVYNTATGVGRAFIQEAATNSNEDFIGNAFELLENKPNPFSDFTVIEWILPSNDEVTIRVQNEMGQVVFEITENGTAGLNQYKLLNKDLKGSGTYYYQVSTPQFSGTKSMLFLK